jgi:hypothetical protein
MPLYHTTATIGVVFWAEDRDAATLGAARAIADEIADNGIVDGVDEPDQIRSGADIPADWRDCIPRYGKGNATCAQIIAAEVAGVPFVDTQTLGLFERGK